MPVTNQAILRLSHFSFAINSLLAWYVRCVIHFLAEKTQCIQPAIPSARNATSGQTALHGNNP